MILALYSSKEQTEESGFQDLFLGKNYPYPAHKLENWWKTYADCTINNYS